MSDSVGGMAALADRRQLIVRIPCLYPYCSATAERNGYCRKHAREARGDRSRHEAGYDYHWVKFRAVYLREHPLCVRCAEHGRVCAANEIHHKQSLREYPALKYEQTNLEALCKSCHSHEIVGKYRKS